MSSRVPRRVPSSSWARQALVVNLHPTPTPTTDPAASKNMGAVFLKKKKAPAATCPEAQGFQKLGANSWRYFFTHEKNWANSWKYFSPMKKMEANSWKYFSPMKIGGIFQKPAKPATDLSHNGHQKIHLVQKPFRLLFPATISLKPFWTGYFRPFRPGTFSTLQKMAWSLESSGIKPGMFTTLQRTQGWNTSLLI